MTTQESTPSKQGSDEAFYELAKLCGPALLKLAGIADSEAKGYRLSAEVLKRKELRPDLSAIPLARGRERVYIEFQGYRDPWVIHRLAMAILMGGQHAASDQGAVTRVGPVRGVVIYTDSAYQRAAQPLLLTTAAGDPTLLGCFAEIVLTDYSEEKLLAIDERLVVLAPFTLSKKSSVDEIGARARHWRDALDEAFSESHQADALNALGLFLLHRFRDLSIQEVWTMLNLDLRQTRAGRQLIEEASHSGRELGRVEGRTEGRVEGRIQELHELLVDGAELRFGTLPEDLATQIRQCQEHAQLRALNRELYRCQDLDAFREMLVQLLDE